VINAAGIMFLTNDRKTLFVKRGGGGDHPNEWCFPGGRAEGDEDAAATAIRECEEETGRKVAAKDLTLLTRSISNTEVGAGPVPADAAAVPDVADLAPDTPPGEAVVQPGIRCDFTTFCVRVEKEFTPTLCEESTGYAWAPIDSPPEPLHPGCRIALARLDMNELHIAKAMAAGQLTSPQRYHNVTLWDMRITGTGHAYRQGRKEHVWRAPEDYMTQEMLDRCNGLPVIMEHPQDRATMDSKEFNDRIVGTIFLPYFRDNEVWGIAKIYDDATNSMLGEYDVSTSPGVILGIETEKYKLGAGRSLLVEDDPCLVDHLAIVPLGTWDKGNDAHGIRVDSVDAPAPDRLDHAKLERADSVVRDMNIRLAMRGYRTSVG
jgi:8-oxo-dGTP pyrophosphatase MutT (NUDIX family)